MALGKISQIMIFALVLNSLVAFVGGAGFFGDDVDVKTAESNIDQFMNKGEDVQKDMGKNESGGFLSLDSFNPINYVLDGIEFVVGFFTNPVFYANALPAPFSYMALAFITVLEITAIIGIFRGVVA